MATDLRLLTFRAACFAESILPRFFRVGDRSVVTTLDGAFHFGWDKLQSSREKRSLLLFAAKIGEFNAVKSLVARCRQIWPNDHFIILAGQAQYLEALHAANPDAVIGTPNIRAPWLWDRFIAISRPRLAIFAEGPSLHCRFPVRSELSLPLALLWHRIPLVVANARVYELTLHDSRRHRLEHRFFRDLFTRAVWHWYAPSESFYRDLVAAGAPPDRITVVGDLKFDVASQSRDAPDEKLARILERYRKSPGPTVVAGSVNDVDERNGVIEAWLALRARHPGARLVLAPRYVNKIDLMEPLYRDLQTLGYDFQRRSRLKPGSDLPGILVIDVFGELRHFYGIATIGYVGHNHGLLEPLRHGTPTVAGPGWHQTHPSYPLYEQLVTAGAVIQVLQLDALGNIFLRILDEPAWAEKYLDAARQTIAENSGATGRIAASLQELSKEPPA